MSDDQRAVTWRRLDRRHWESEERGNPDTAPLLRAMQGDDGRWRVSISDAPSLDGPFRSFSEVLSAVPRLLQQRALRRLFEDWLRARFYLIGAISSDIAADYRALIEEARQRADIVGLPWDDELVPEHVHDTIEALEDQ